MTFIHYLFLANFIEQMIKQLIMKIIFRLISGKVIISWSCSLSIQRIFLFVCI